MQSAGTESCTITTAVPFLMPGQVDPVDGTLMRLEFAVTVYFSRPQQVVAGFFLVWIVTKRVLGCEEVCLSPVFPFHLQTILPQGLISKKNPR